MHNTFFALMAEYGTGTVELQQVSEKYFGLSIREANRRANRHALPIPTFRAVESQKAPHLINISDLAAHLDQIRDKAYQEYRAVNE